jgi:Mg-chelatase subunit ChlD
MASFVPTFEPKNPQEFTEVQSETPESAPLQTGEDFHFIFVVDRSGSMQGRRMELT